MVVKRPIIPRINPGSISKLCGSQKDYKTQKVARPKKAEKKDKKGKEEARKKFGTANRKKTSKFWLKRKHQIYILYMFGLVFGKSIFLVKKNNFFGKTRARLASQKQKKTVLTIKNGLSVKFLVLKHILPKLSFFLHNSVQLTHLSL